MRRERGPALGLVKGDDHHHRLIGRLIQFHPEDLCLLASVDGQDLMRLELADVDPIVIVEPVGSFRIGRRAILGGSDPDKDPVLKELPKAGAHLGVVGDHLSHDVPGTGPGIIRRDNLVGEIGRGDPAQGGQSSRLLPDQLG